MKKINTLRFLVFKLILISLNLSAQITSTDGLENLKSIDGDLIISKTQITNLDGFIALNNVSGDIIIKNNSLLTDYCGLKNLFQNGVIGGETIIQGNQIDLDTANLDFSSCTLSVSDDKKEAVLFHPNPVVDYIHLPKTEYIKKVSIYNAMGRLMVVKEANFSTINLSSLASGYYTVKIKDTSNKITNIKLIKK